MHFRCQEQYSGLNVLGGSFKDCRGTAVPAQGVKVSVVGDRNEVIKLSWGNCLTVACSVVCSNMSDGGCRAAEHGVLVSHLIEGNNLVSSFVVFWGFFSRNVEQTMNHLITTKNQPRTF